jgi:hypothetical protein
MNDPDRDLSLHFWNRRTKFGKLSAKISEMMVNRGPRPTLTQALDKEVSTHIGANSPALEV